MSANQNESAMRDTQLRQPRNLIKGKPLWVKAENPALVAYQDLSER